jgi:hypothetical protein
MAEHARIGVEGLLGLGEVAVEAVKEKLEEFTNAIEVLQVGRHVVSSE